MKRKKIAIVAGTRPECIKMAPVYFELKKSEQFDAVFLATAQHRQMLDQTLSVFGIEPEHDLDLMVPGQTLAGLTSRVLQSVNDWCLQEKPDAILVQGDTTTVLASAIAAFYNNVAIGHVEAGLRTGNLRSPFPEEMNRKLTSPIANWHFCPTETSRQNLLREGVPDAAVHVTGNTVVDALLWVNARLEQHGITSGSVAKRLQIPGEFARRFLDDPKSRWILVTGHRRESFGGGFERICHAIAQITKEFDDVGVLYPVHLNPQVQEPVKRLLGNNPAIALVEPAGYEDFVWLMNRAYFILSDSGGVQEEAPSLGKPVLVMRDTTERPEGITAGTCRLVGTDPTVILRESSILLADSQEYRKRTELKNPYGDGSSSKQIRSILEKELA